MTLIAKKLKLLGKTQTEIANEVGVSQAYIASVIKGKILKTEAIKKFADVYGWDVYEIMRDFENMSNEDFISHLPEPTPKENPTTKDAMKQLGKIQNGKNKNKSDGKVLSSGDVVSIKTFVIPMKGFAGLKNAIYDDQYITDNFEETTTEVPHHLYYPISYRIQSSGESMPKSIPNNAWVTGVPVAEMLWLDYNFRPDKIYILFHPYRGILFKHVENLPNDEIKLCSENEDKHDYPDEVFKITEFRKILLAIKVETFI